MVSWFAKKTKNQSNVTQKLVDIGCLLNKTFHKIQIFSVLIIAVITYV